MNAASQLQCLLDSGNISQAFYNSAIKIASKVSDLGAALALVGQTPYLTDDIVISGATLIPVNDCVFAVITADADMTFKVVAGGTAGHFMAADTNYKFSDQELQNLSITGTGNVTVTWYK